MGPQIESISVIILDSDGDFVDRATRLLEASDERLSVVPASSTSEALDLIDTSQAECLIVEHDGPDLDGIALLADVRRADPDIPFVLVAENGSQELASESISLGVTEYLPERPGSEQFELLASRIAQAVEEIRVERQRRQHFQAIDTAHEGIGIISPDGTFSYVNASYADLYGYEPEEMVGERFEMTYPEGELDAIQGDTFRAIEEQGYWHGDTMGIRSDGTTFVEDHKLVMTEQGDLICTVRHKSQERVERDSIGGLHSAVQALMEAETVGEAAETTITAIRKLVDLPMNAVYTHDGEGTLDPVAWTEEVADMVGAIHDADDPAFQVFETGIREVVADVSDRSDHPRTNTPIRTELLLPLGDYGVLQIGSDSANAFDETDVALAQTLAAHAATAIRGVQSKQQLREEREFIDQAVETLNDVFYVLDGDWHLQRWNDRLVEVSGYGPEIERMAIGDFFPESERRRAEAACEEAMADGEVTFEAHVRTADGEDIPYEFACARLTDRDGEASGLVGIGRDITERREREHRLEQQNDRLDEFASIVSHDLRNPLNVAQGRLELARQECESSHLEDVNQAHARMKTLIDDLLTLSREGEQVDEREAVDIADAIERCWQHVDTREASLQITSTVTIDANPSRLNQLFENLIRNAIEHGGDGVTVTVGDLADGFFVADDGPGVPESQRDGIFDAGYSTLDEGTGFGLAIVQQVVNAHGWTIEVSASESGGTRFEIIGVDIDT